jgi:antagonist of KipI
MIAAPSACMQVLRPGMFSVLQDLGRVGHQCHGVPVTGAMDEWSHRSANILVGNAEDAAVLECTLTGPTVQFTRNTLLAVCGAELRITAADRPVPKGCAVMLRRGVTLEFGERHSGMRMYLAVRGGFATAPVLGSRSTYLPGNFGGHEGRALRKNDRVPLAPSDRDEPLLALERLLVQSGSPFVAAARGEAQLPAGSPEGLRFIAGPQWNAFSTEAKERFVSLPFTISARSDRMGCRLEGPNLQLTQPLEMISEATSFGTVQVPPDGRPIVLMADRQSAGGYPKLAYVASADLPRLAQAPPGTSIRFTRVDQFAAERAWLHFEDQLALVRETAARALA